MSEIVKRLEDFVSYRAKLKGDEKGEAQVFCDRLFQAFGHKGYKEAGAELEHRIKGKDNKGTSFADLIWKPRLLLEMKKSKENLLFHYQQAFDYWINAVPNRPRYVVLCNFDEFWIYDLDKQLNEPVDKIAIEDLPKRYAALNFLFEDEKKPIFGNDLEEVTRKTADQVADLFQRLVIRKVNRDMAQRFVLQLIVCMFAEDIDLLPANIVSKIVDDCLNAKQSSYDLFAGLFQQMNNKVAAKGGRFEGVPYFNGGLFQKIDPIELRTDELLLIGGDKGAASKNWAKVDPVIFGSIFQHSMEAEKRHAYGAHYTHEADIQRIVGPTIIRPWREEIDSAKTVKQLSALRTKLTEVRVLDPACGSGNFLYVSFREMARLETRILLRIKEIIGQDKLQRDFKTAVSISPKQFFGIELDSFGADLAKVTLMIAKKLAVDEARKMIGQEQEELGYSDHEALPLDNLDQNILNKDALFEPWPEADVIVSNPPYQSKNKIQEELGIEYINRLRDLYTDIDGRADYCVYWFRKAHNLLKAGQRAGMVGTNTIRQNYSRESGLDHIVADGGTITEAVSSMIWPDEAAVHVSIVNWIKGKQLGKKKLYIQEGNDVNSGWRHDEFPVINSSLSFNLDVTSAQALKANARSGCFQGQTHGNEKFLVSSNEGRLLLLEHPEYSAVLYPFLIANELIGAKDSKPKRFVIDFHKRDVFEAKKYSKLYKQVEKFVLPDRQKMAEKESERNKSALRVNPNAKVNRHHENFLNKWWIMSYPREDMIAQLEKLKRFIVCGQVTKRPIFEFLSPKIRPNAALQVFAFDDDYSFGILQSSIHWDWFREKCSTLKSDFRYTSNTVFDSFPWPQGADRAQVKNVAKAAQELRQVRNQIRHTHKLSLREVYRQMELPGKNEIKTAQEKLDREVEKAYGLKPGIDSLQFLLELNLKLSKNEKSGAKIVGPGVPKTFGDKSELVSDDCLKF